MIKYNPLFHNKSLRLLLPKHSLSNMRIHNKLLLMGFMLPPLPTEKKVVAYVIHPQDMSQPCSMIVIDTTVKSVPINISYAEGVELYNKFEFDELEFDFFEKRYGRS